MSYENFNNPEEENLDDLNDLGEKENFNEEKDKEGEEKEPEEKEEEEIPSYYKEKQDED